MFHVRDLLEGARTIDWVPGGDPIPEALQRIRRRHGVDLNGISGLQLPDNGDLGVCKRALADAVERLGIGVLPSIVVALREPESVLASDLHTDGTRTYWLVGAGRHDGDASADVVVATFRATPRSRGAPKLSEGTIDVYTDADEAELRKHLESIYCECFAPLRVVRLRGRKHGPPVAVWVGEPDAPPDDDFRAGASAIAALDGYELRLVTSRGTALKQLLRAVHDSRPEVLILWSVHLAPRVVDALSGATDAEVFRLESDGAGALDELREWMPLASVRYFESEPDPPDVSTMQEAVSTAESRADHLVFVTQAKSRAKESNYKDPDEVLRGLEDLDRLAGLYKSGDFDGPMEQLFRDRSTLVYRDGISEQTRNKHRQYYELDWQGAKHLMGPHICFGSAWESQYCARVYWYVDSGTRAWVVGHVGKHLPGAND